MRKRFALEASGKVTVPGSLILALVALLAVLFPVAIWLLGKLK